MQSASRIDVKTGEELLENHGKLKYFIYCCSFNFILFIEKDNKRVRVLFANINIDTVDLMFT